MEKKAERILTVSDGGSGGSKNVQCDRGRGNFWVDVGWPIVTNEELVVLVCKNVRVKQSSCRLGW